MLRATDAAGPAAELTPTRVVVLLNAVRNGPIRLAELAEQEGLNPTMLSRTVANLVEAGLVVTDRGRRRPALGVGRRRPTRAGGSPSRSAAHRTQALREALSGLQEDDQLTVGAGAAGARAPCRAALHGALVTRIRRISRTTFAALAIPNYRLYIQGQAVSLIGTWMQMTAQSWLVLELTHSATALGLIVALQTLPVLVLGPYGGVIADRVDKRRDDDRAAGGDGSSRR